MVDLVRESNDDLLPFHGSAPLQAKSCGTDHRPQGGGETILFIPIL